MNSRDVVERIDSTQFKLWNCSSLEYGRPRRVNCVCWHVQRSEGLVSRKPRPSWEGRRSCSWQAWILCVQAEEVETEFRGDRRQDCVSKSFTILIALMMQFRWQHQFQRLQEGALDGSWWCNRERWHHGMRSQWESLLERECRAGLSRKMVVRGIRLVCSRS